jgi:hypothetical protein
MFTTKLNVVLRDCTNKVLYTSPEATSRDKDNKVAFPKALREAFFHLGSLNYKYNGGPAPSASKPVATESISVENASPNDQLFAQPLDNGYQIVDSSPKIVLLLKNTSAEGVFIAERADAKGIVFNKQGRWYFEYYSNGKLVTEQMKIKF